MPRQYVQSYWPISFLNMSMYSIYPCSINIMCIFHIYTIYYILNKFRLKLNILCSIEIDVAEQLGLLLTIVFENIGAFDVRFAAITDAAKISHLVYEL